VNIYPPTSDIFRVFQIPVSDIKIVILGQDPYHGKGQANGLSFSVNKGIKIPPSLSNIFKEICTEFPDRNYIYDHGDLSRWSEEEGIFLLNSALTVIESKPSSHIKLWEEFTDDVIKFISHSGVNCEKPHNIIFLLLGNFAQSKSKYIASGQHNIIKAVHPSPLSAYNGFFGSGVFKQVELLLGSQINWQN
jgi:uracil-DNA glycosylase